ncbi:MAG: serine/threonine protein kinase [Planctomycetota bacterium]
MSEQPGGWNPEQTQPLRSPPKSLRPPDSGLQPGAVDFGPYRLIRKIGRGGVGDVYQAEDLETHHCGILKRLHREIMDQPGARKRFAFEMEIGRLLRHPNLVAVRECGEVAGRQFIFMEEVSGPSLRRLLQGSAPWEVTTQGLLEALEQVAKGIAFAHRNGIVHGDLKPENMLFHSLRQPVVIDFGLAHRGEAPPPIKTAGEIGATGYLMGTPMYMPPETIAARRGGLTPAGDVYSFGVMLYEVLAGRPPFLLEVGGARQAAVMKLIEQVVNETPPPIRSLRPEVAEAWDDLCQRCLQKKPAKRPASLDGVAQDVGWILRTGKPRPAGGGDSVVRRMSKWFE